jgi:NAD(P)H-dependent flavin oxidoreductase YrpB (nitropropane dioxygenase family)
MPKAKAAKPRKGKPIVQVKSPPERAPEPLVEDAPTPSSALHTRICQMFGIQYPIIQTGMGWVSGATLTSATSNAGGLGILAAATMTFPELERAIAKVKARTDKPFGVNMRADQSDVMKRVDLLIREKVKVASFAQAPGERVIKTLKDAGVLTMPTIGARRHAEKVQAWGVDAVIAQGQEGGGHTGQIPTSILIPDVSAAVDIPVVGAGGFRDGRGLVAALALGGSGIAMGTRFLLTQESQVPDQVKQIYLKTKANGTVVTKAVDGHPQRVIRTALIEQLERANPIIRFPRAALNALSLMRVTGTSLPELLEEGIAMKQNQELTWSQLAMAANAPMLTKATMVDGKVEAGILPTGQIAGVIDEIPTVAQLLQRIIAEAQQTLDRLGA